MVVTGIGLVSPLAANSHIAWERLIKGNSGIKALPSALYGDTPVKIGGLVPTLEKDKAGGNHYCNQYGGGSYGYPGSKQSSYPGKQKIITIHHALIFG